MHLQETGQFQMAVLVSKVPSQDNLLPGKVNVMASVMLSLNSQLPARDNVRVMFPSILQELVVPDYHILSFSISCVPVDLFQCTGGFRLSWFCHS